MRSQANLNRDTQAHSAILARERRQEAGETRLALVALALSIISMILNVAVLVANLT